jgi:hypothetical protein
MSISSELLLSISSGTVAIFTPFLPHLATKLFPGYLALKKFSRLACFASELELALMGIVPSFAESSLRGISFISVLEIPRSFFNPSVISVVIIDFR